MNMSENRCVPWETVFDAVDHPTSDVLGSELEKRGLADDGVACVYDAIDNGPLSWNGVTAIEYTPPQQRAVSDTEASGAAEFLSECFFVRIDPGDKTPLDWGWGYPESKPENPPLEENPKVFSGSKADEWLREWHNWWGVLDHPDRNLIILDVDSYKPEFPDEHTDCEFIKRHEREGMVVESQSGGKHIYIQFDGDGHPEDIEVALPAVEEKGGLPGNRHKGYGITPIDSPYELIADNAPLVEDRDSLLESPFYQETEEKKETSSAVKDHEPTKSRSEVADIETTTDYDDVLDALNVAEPDDVTLPRSVGTRDGYIQLYDPSDFGYRTSKSGDSLEYHGDGDWWDQEDFRQPLSTFDVWCSYHGYTDHPADSLKGADFEQAVDDFRADGAPIPEFINNNEPRECEPPGGEFVGFDERRIRENEIPAAIEDYRQGDEIVIIGHTGGSGKTVTTIKHCVENDIPFVMFFHNHDLIEKVLEDEKCPLHPDHPDVLHLQGQPRLCTIPPEDKSRFQKIKSIGGPGLAHRVVEPHDEKCEWQEQFSKIDSHDFIFAPHEYQGHNFPGKMPIIDERAKPVWKTHRNFSVDNIREFADVMREWHGELDDQNVTNLLGIYEKLADYADEVVEYIENGEITPTLNVSPRTLAQTKIQYNRRVLKNPDLPMIYDALMAFADELEVVNVPPFLNRCPQCSAGTHPRNGIMTCNDCGWNEQEELLNGSARAGARRTYFQDGHRLEYRKLRETPLKPLILDATYDTRQTELLYQADVSDVYGDENYERNCYTTQLVTGQYHGSTAKNEYPQERFKQVAEAAVQRFENPLFFMKEDVFDRAKDLYPDFWTNLENVMAYGEHRGVTRKDCDAVFVFGALHPDLEDLKFKADILGGDAGRLSAEHLEAKNLEYQKINYSDKNGRGRKIPTKTFDGYLGHRFRKIRQNAIEQASFRIRAITSEEPKYVFLLTNVPTDLQIDRLVDWSDLSKPFQLKVPDGAKELARQLDGKYTRNEILSEVDDRGITPQGAKTPAKEHTVDEWISKLETKGLIDKSKSGFPCKTSYHFESGDTIDISEKTILRPDQIDRYREEFDIQW